MCRILFRGVYLCTQGNPPNTSLYTAKVGKQWHYVTSTDLKQTLCAICANMG